MTIYRAAGGVNREIKKQYRGVGGVNREIKEQYRGVGGVNRKVFSPGIFPILYDNGVEDLAVSGGWTPSSGNCGQIVATKNTNNLYVCSNASGSNNAASFMTVNTIDLTNYTYLKFNSTTPPSGSAYIGQIGLCTYAPTFATLANSDGQYGRVKTVDVRAGSIPTQLDVSNYNGLYYIYFGVNEGNAYYTRQITMSKIWLE